MQHIIIEEVISYIISNKRCYYQNIGKQLLLYIRKERKMRKNRVIEAICLRFNFLIRKSECLIVVFRRIVVANNKDVIIYKTLGINKQVKNKKQ